MKYILIVFCFVIMPLDVSAKDKFTFGLGYGPMYSGLGANVGYVNNEHLIYISTGCLNVDNDGTACGGGLGYVTTAFFNGKKHGLGVFFGLVDDELYYDEKEYLFDLDRVYGINFSYSYFFKGISKSGFNAGGGLSLSKPYDDIEPKFTFQVGYQF